MKNILILLTVLLLPILAYAQSKSSFSSMEVNHVRVATPGLFAKSNHIYLHLDSLQAVSYTHLDVYKRQGITKVFLLVFW